MNQLLITPSFKTLHALIRRTAVNSRNIRKLEACIKLYGGLVEVYPPALQSLSTMLSHRFPKVRAAVVEELWVRLDAQDSVGDEEQKKDPAGEVAGREGLKGFDWIKAKKEEVQARWEGILHDVETEGQ